ncbi:hypothetical protein BH10CYA1_BH10CYA1_60800 [soil metagenome]
MKKILPLASLASLVSMITLFANANLAIAQVEPRMAGEWHSTDSEQSLHIQPDGRYQTKANGQVVDSGKLTGTNSAWRLKSDSGRSDNGTFTFISGNMHLHGGMSGAWSRSASSSTSKGSSTYSATPHQITPSAQTPVYTPNYTPSQPPTPIDSVTPPHNSQSYSSMYGHGQRPALPGYSAKTEGAQAASTTTETPTTSTAPQKKRWSKTISEYASGIGSAAASHVLGTSPQMNGSGAQGSSYSGSPGYTSTNNSGAPPRGDYVSPYWAGVAGEHISASEMNKKYPPGRGMPYNQTTEHWEHVQQQNRPASPGWQTMPRGGYIPVMKDNKARRYWGH